MLGNSDPNYLGDLIKIGIPSAVTIVSAILNWCMFVSNKKKDIAIEKIRFSNDQLKVKANRQSDLIKEIANKVAAVESAFANHTGVYRNSETPLEIENSSNYFEDAESAFKELGISINSCVGINALVHLLGERTVIASFKIYLEALYTYQNIANPSKAPDIWVLQEKYGIVETHHSKFMSELSKMFTQ